MEKKLDKKTVLRGALQMADELETVANILKQEAGLDNTRDEKNDVQILAKKTITTATNLKRALLNLI